MDEFTADAFANRDDPIPVMQIDPHDDLSEGEESPTERTRERLRKHVKNFNDHLRKKSEPGFSMQDRLMEK